jgi:hypothetical protein
MVMAMAGLGAPQGAVALSCAEPQEQRALQMRVLQTEFMIAALSCPIRGEYNRFVEKFRGELRVQGKALRGFFTRMHGSAGERRLNRFVTRMANEASHRGATYGATFCTDAAARFDAVLTMRPTRLVAYAANQPSATAHGFEACMAIEPATASQQSAKAD